MKRSIRIAHHNTSVSLEPEFWDALKDLAAEDHVSLKDLVTEIDAQRTCNLSRALRLYVLKRLRKQI
ncbi:MAG: ribbon-helix-helix domain-containing protein [Alphaproteobacteria bacterium]|nr:ribbon-helix-helix domain-containing protein [Alphaproteobacteria bacterium]